MVPVQPGVGGLDPIGELPADRDGGLGLVRHAVVTVLQPQPVPVDGGVEIPFVGDVDDDFAALLDFGCGTGDGAVIAQHPHGGVAEPLGHRADPQMQRVTVSQFQQRRLAGLWQPGRIGREHPSRRGYIGSMVSMVLHGSQLRRLGYISVVTFDDITEKYDSRSGNKETLSASSTLSEERILDEVLAWLTSGALKR